MVSFRYDGNYCGPGWSAGKYQPSVGRSNVPALNQFDRTCKRHDAAYYFKRNLKEADYKFYRENIGRGFKRSAAALAVGIQGFLRKPQPFLENKKRKVMAPLPVYPTPQSNRRGRSATRSTSSRRSRMSTSTGVRPMSISTTRSRRSGGSIFSRSRSRSRSMASTYMRGSSAKTGGFSGRIRKGRSKGTKRQKMEANGTQFILEQGSLLDSPTQSALGHASFVPTQVLRVLMGSILRKCLLKLGHQYNTLDEVMTDSFTNGDEFLIWGRTDEIGNGTILINVNTFNIALTTWNDFITLMSNAYIAWLETNAAPHSPMMLFFEYRPVSNAALPAVHKYGRIQINLQDARLKLYIKSDMKIQNRTVSVSTDNEADDVNNVPVIGKVFDGSGTGALPNVAKAGATDFRLIGNVNTGIIVNPGSTLSTGGEPLTKKNFKHVTAEGGMKIGPGEIKTSTLIHSATHGVDVLLKNLFDVISAGVLNPNQRIPFGKFRFFQFDRLIDIGSTQSNITMAWEINYYISGNILLGRPSAVLPKYQRATF